MRKSEELANPNSCINKAEQEEPVFVLRANDEIAPGLVRKWAEMYAKTKSRQREGMSPRQVAKYEEALQLADQMDHWRQHRGVVLASHEHATPGAIVKRPLEARDVIARLCQLQESVFRVLGPAEAADCFCGDGGYWPREGDTQNKYDGTLANGYRNDGRCLEFIEQAVREKIQRMQTERMTGHSVEHVESIVVDGKSQ